ncbi:MAG TPA: hypothetical protein VMI11_09205 [Actinomycetes bacterium]|nr:hypothetical protein [Actinomycetes bacterium]
MLDALAQVLVCAALFLALRWGLHRVDALGRPGRFPAIAVVALVLPALVFATPGVHRRAEQKQLAAAASELIGIRVSVHCQTFGQAFVDGGTELGYVKWGAGGVPEHRTLIKHDQCADLRGYLHSSKVHPTLDQVIAVHVLTHESMHMSGITDEALAECAAVQRDARMAQLLGATPGAGLYLARTYWRVVYPDMPDGYVSGECRPGGLLDEHLPDAPWS